MTGARPGNLGTEGQILYDANKKSKLVAYLLWLILGGFGAHRLYTRRFLSGLAQFAIIAVGYGLMFYTMWPMMQAGLNAAKTAAETGQPVDPATMPHPDAAAVEAMVQNPLYLAGVALMLIWFVWWIVDAFLIPGWIRRHNEMLAVSLAGR